MHKYEIIIYWSEEDKVFIAEAPELPLREIRGRGGGPTHTRLRHLIIRRLHAAGFRNTDIARYLDVSDSAVSYFVRKPAPR